MSIVHTQHYFRGLQVYRSRAVQEGRGDRLGSPLYSIPSSIPLDPTVLPIDAFGVAADELEAIGAVRSKLSRRLRRQVHFRELPERPTILDITRSFAEPVRLHLEVFPQPRRKAQLVWVIDLKLKDRASFQAVVTARGPARLLFAARIESRLFNAEWVPPSGPSVVDQFPIGPIATPGPAAAQPSAWLPPGGTSADGPNLSVHLKQSSPATSLTSPQASNVFVYGNLLHDFFHEFGFDSTNGAFEGNDPLFALHLSNRKKRGGVFDNLQDGWRPVMMLYEGPAGGTHAALDPSIVVHEYAHGVSSRLVAGGRFNYPFIGREAVGFSEGMSDYFALTLLSYFDRSRGNVAPLEVIGGRYQPPNGVRDYRGFTTAFNKNQKDAYEIGKVWCAAMLLARDDVATLAGDIDRADRFVWLAIIDAFKATTLDSPRHAELTLSAAKANIVAAATRLEVPRTLGGAAAAISAALTSRGI